MLQQTLHRVEKTFMCILSLTNGLNGITSQRNGLSNGQSGRKKIRISKNRGRTLRQTLSNTTNKQHLVPRMHCYRNSSHPPRNIPTQNRYIEQDGESAAHHLANHLSWSSKDKRARPLKKTGVGQSSSDPQRQPPIAPVLLEVKYPRGITMDIKG